MLQTTKFFVKILIVMIAVPLKLQTDALLKGLKQVKSDKMFDFPCMNMLKAANKRKEVGKEERKK